MVDHLTKMQAQWRGFIPWDHVHQTQWVIRERRGQVFRTRRLRIITSTFGPKPIMRGVMGLIFQLEGRPDVSGRSCNMRVRLTLGLGGRVAEDRKMNRMRRKSGSSFSATLAGLILDSCWCRLCCSCGGSACLWLCGEVGTTGRMFCITA